MKTELNLRTRSKIQFKKKTGAARPRGLAGGSVLLAGHFAAERARPPRALQGNIQSL